MITYTVNLNDIVKSVNGVFPDGAGNVTISIPASVNAYNSDGPQTGNRTFTGAGYTLTFDGQSGIRFNPNVGFGDDSQSNIKVQIFTSSLDKALAAQNGTAGGKAIEGIASGTNAFGAQLQAQGVGGTGAKILGDAAGVVGQTTDDNGTAVVAQGSAMVKDWDDNGARLDSSVLHIKSTTKATYFEPMTKAQRDAISPSPGMLIYMSEDMAEPEGFYQYHSVSGWARILLDV
jgi:hypothetical protein